MALKLNPLLLNRGIVKASRLPVFQHRASTSRGSHIEKHPRRGELGTNRSRLARARSSPRSAAVPVPGHSTP